MNPIGSMTPIRVDLSAVDHRPSTVKVSVTNTSPEKCYELSEQAFSENLAENNFRVVDQSNTKASYIGPRIDRAEVLYTQLNPGETRSIQVPLDQLYDLPRSNPPVQYSVQYQVAHASYRACGGDAENFSEIKSNKIDIKV